MLSICGCQALGGEHVRKASSSAAALRESVLFSYPFTVSMTRQTRGKKGLGRALPSFYLVLSQIKILSYTSQTRKANVLDRNIAQE